MAKKPRVIHTCTECGYSSPKWLGRCPECGSWGTLQEEAPAASGPVKTSSLTPSAPASPITKVEAAATKTVKSGIRELDRVLGSGVAVSYTHLTLPTKRIV